MHTLCLNEEEQRGDCHLCARTPDEYLAAIRRGNAELDAFATDPAHVSSLAFVEEPVRYRHPGFDIGRLELPELADRSTKVIFDPRLPPAVSTRPDILFTRP